MKCWKNRSGFPTFPQGLFDVSVGPVVKLWREARQTGRLPDAAEIARAKALVDYRNIELDAAHYTAFLKRAGMMLDLGAIGKGYAADQMLAVLQAQGITHAMVVAGGRGCGWRASAGRFRMESWPGNGG